MHYINEDVNENISLCTSSYQAMSVFSKTTAEILIKLIRGNTTVNIYLDWVGGGNREQRENMKHL